ncbi:hypothetical protein [Candidatus Poriferisodalis sp.]|uniref:hypothetical protein n=1 Tax=Candidatus Poriferisodalis sp. TaxID=3101277 RepID=UPI003B01632C
MDWPEAGEVIDWIDANLVNPHGDLAGEPFGLLDHERELIEGVCSHTEAAWSAARGQRKTPLAAAIAAAYVAPGGPFDWLPAGRQVVIVAASGDQASLALTDLSTMLGESWPGAKFANSPTMRRWDATELGGGECKVISSNPKTAHGLRPGLVVADEMAQWPVGWLGPMMAALRTARGKVPGSRFIAIGTRSHIADHVFSKMLDSTDAASWSKVHAAEPADDLGAYETWCKAAPSLPVLPTLQAAYRQEWGAAQKDPSQLAAFKSLRLNMGTRDTIEAVVVDADVWRDAEGDLPADGPCVWGLDLGGVAAMSAAAAYWPHTGRLEAFGYFPGDPDLTARGLADGVGTLYEDMARRGELRTVAGSRTVPPVELLGEALERWGTPAAMAGDRYRQADLIDAFRAAGIPRVPMTWANLSWKDSAEALRRFRVGLLEDQVRPVPSLLLRSALAEARTVTDQAGNERLATKTESGRRRTGKDDALAAAIQAVAVGTPLIGGTETDDYDDDLILAVT